MLTVYGHLKTRVYCEFEADEVANVAAWKCDGGGADGHDGAMTFFGEFRINEARKGHLMPRSQSYSGLDSSAITPCFNRVYVRKTKRAETSLTVMPKRGAPGSLYIGWKLNLSALFSLPVI